MIGHALLVGRASIAPLTTEGHFRACRSLLGVPHSEEWFLFLFSAPELLMGRASTAPLTQRVTYEHAAPLWASEFPPLILRNDSSALQSLLYGRANFAPLT